ncbi:hypothetical protein G7B40_021815 [Aetokthonos hydrillicola Thurmond2011]|jgi:hypothetical protein|uniref:Uncharacterized protein n=1 Tax=Aetokthonos hydrillicola Thurmond2011 TaxID=2712845 RepID=A0AAP5I974_9CYAN|nr:hypothetical protein [Aetokthonos hydrillicola]MBO3457805.1 hypothetical protein [Aetokthonos hydrillicola CCALA 1050]MBW4588337.1 hypothetical protein [Aetokthonos hydrillicola CCALA 1050]MDR9897181.1 hypothetical protein [Aetokthonos hydrillicola Thurmond2011]
MDTKLDTKAQNGKIFPEAVEWVLKQIVVLPRNWLIITTIFIVLSTFQISKDKQLSIKFQVTNTTAIFLALTWLPSVLKIFALSGGALKTPGVEITNSSVVPILQSLSSDSLGFLIEQTKQGEDVAPLTQQQEVRKVRHECQKVYASRFSGSEIRQQMERLAERYKEVRRLMPSSPQRTFEMESITGRLRALAPKVDFSAKEVLDFLQSSDQGKRLQGLSITEWSGDPIYFESVLHIINYSQTAFEQTSALRAAHKMIPQLNDEQKKDLQQVLTNQRDYNPDEKRWIKPDSNRWTISDRILSALQS